MVNDNDFELRLVDLLKLGLVWLIVMFTLIIMLASLVSGATPNIVISDNLNTTLSYDDKEIGSIILVHSGWTPTTFEHSTFDTLEVGAYDLFRWQGNQSISIASTILSPGGSYQPTTAGDIVYSSISDPNLTGILRVNRPPTLNVLVNHTGQVGLDYQSSFVLSGERNLLVFSNVAETLGPGNYNTRFNIRVADQNLTYDKTFTMPVLNNLVFNTSNYTTIIGSGENQRLANLSFGNDGNTPTQVSIVSEGNVSQFLFIPSSFSVLPQVGYSLPLIVQVPFGSQFDNYVGTVRFVSEKKNYSVLLNLSVVDIIQPNISGIIYSNTDLGRKSYINISATDNNNISRVTISYNGNTTELLRSGTVWQYHNIFQNNSYNFVFCAWDVHNNSHCKNSTVEYTKYAVLDFNNTLTLPSSRQNVYSSIPAFELYDTIMPVGVSLNSLLANQENNLSIRLLGPDGTVYDLDTNFSENHTRIPTNISLQGVYMLEVSSDSLIQYDGVLNFSLPSYASEQGRINFKGRIVEYDIPESFVRNDFCGNYPLEMIVEDTGIFDTSYVEFYYKCPINLAPSEQPVLVSQEYLAIRDREMNTTVSGYVRGRNQMAVAFASSMSLALLLGLISMYSMLIFPRLRFRKVIR